MAMKLGICPKCKQLSIEYYNAKIGGVYRDVLECRTPACNWFVRDGHPAYAGIHAHIFPILPEDPEKLAGYWDNRCAAISPVVRVSGCGTRVEGHCDVRD